MKLIGWLRSLDKVSLFIETILIGGVVSHLAGFIYIIYLFNTGAFGPRIN